MSWFILLAAGAVEAVWARALAASEGFRNIVPSFVFAVGLVISLGGLSIAMKTIPAGTAYAVWVGVGASLTVAWGIARGEEPATLPRLVVIGLLIACVAGLKVVS